MDSRTNPAFPEPKYPLSPPNLHTRLCTDSSELELDVLRDDVKDVPFY